MKKLSVELKNCHGIHHLSAELNFEQGTAIAIYAPNGTMKTSFARTFADLSKDMESKDHMFPDRDTQRFISDESGAPLSSSDVVVILSYDEEMGPTEATSTLLVDADLRKEYEALQVDVHEARDELVSALKAQAKTRKDVAQRVSTAFTSDDESFFTALLRVQGELDQQNTAPFADVPYDVVFDDKVVALLRTPEVRSALADYVSRFNELLDASTYFSRQTFNYYNAANITKSLADNGFFSAHHSVLLYGGDASEEVTTEADLIALIEAEKQKIAEDAQLRKTFTELEKKLTRNVELRTFYTYISEHVELLPQMENIDRFDELVWKSYLKLHEGLYRTAIERYQAAESRKKEIEGIAAQQSTQWETVIRIFNERFFVPFKLTAKNREKVMLGQEEVLQLGFEFEDGADRATVEKGELLEVLSTGEKKALYILNVLFEVQTRLGSGRETLFLIDDIADSFDYKNKYAIIQYLKEMSEEPDFRLIILTHNFDFYRTLESRLVRYSHCLVAQKNTAGISLVQAEGIRNPFIFSFKPEFFAHPMKRIASIPFIRNLLEYTQGSDGQDYLKLTSLLHWKRDSQTVTQAELDSIFLTMFGVAGTWADPDEAVIDLVLAQADLCINASTSINFENKIVLSIAIRLLAEKYMIEQIADPVTTDAISANQTQALFQEFRRRFGAADALRTLDSVVLMTPEHIHVNSFMYEPILDMADDHLRKLHQNVKALAVVSEAEPYSA